MAKIALTLAVADLYPYETQVLTPPLERIYILEVKYFSTKVWKIVCIKPQKNICIYLSVAISSFRCTKRHKGYRNLLIWIWRCLASNSNQRQRLKGSKIPMWSIIPCLPLVHLGNTDQQDVPRQALFSFLRKTMEDAQRLQWWAEFGHMISEM